MSHISNGNPNADNLVPNLYRGIEVIPAVDIGVAVIIRRAVKIAGVLEHLIAVIEHGRLALVDFFKHFPDAGVVQFGLQDIPIYLKLIGSALQAVEELA